MSPLVAFAVALSAGYLAGSIPVGYLIGRRMNTDVRAYGSGSVGALNVMRSLGPKFSALVFGLDFVKGFVPTLLAWLFLTEISVFIAPVAGLAAVVGHVWPIWMRLRGGKGASTSFGLLVGLAPSAIWWGGLVAFGFAVFVAVTFATRYVSLAVVVALTTLTLMALVAFLLAGRDMLPYLVAASCAGTIVIYGHRANIGRLRRGQERRFTLKSRVHETHPDGE